MAFQRGRPKTGGRKRGTPNRITATVREAYELAFQEVNQGATALAEWGKQHPDKFYTIAARLIPLDLHHRHDPGSPIIHAPIPFYVTEGEEPPAMPRLPDGRFPVVVPPPMSAEEWEAANAEPPTFPRGAGEYPK